MPLDGPGDLLEFQLKGLRFAAETGAHLFEDGNLVGVHMTLFNGFFCFHVANGSIKDSGYSNTTNALI